MRKQRSGGIVKAVLIPILIIAIVLVFFTALSNLKQGSSTEGLDRLETSIRRACASCYATEGFYPPTLEYLTGHYGIQIDESRYRVFYDAFAENLMPEITVLEIDHEAK